MASILRSSKFVRYVAGFAKNALVGRSRDFEVSLVNTAQCMCNNNSHNYSTQSSVLSDHSLETSLKRIDQDVRRSGRISRRDIEEVLDEIRLNKSATSSQSLLVIRCCGNLVPDELPETRTALVKEIWNTLNRLNIPMDISHYNALLRVYLENEHSFSPLEFLAELESKGIEPNRVTYQRLISRYCQVGDIDGATKILHYMREKQISVNENVFNALIVGHSKSGDMDSAEGIINIMAQAGLEPSADTYTTLISGYAMKGDLEKIFKLIDECEKKEIYLLDKDYLDIIYSLVTNGYSNQISKILEHVKKTTGYNQDAINVILRLINKGHEDAGLILLKSLPRNTNEDGNPFPSGMFFVKQLVKAKRPVEKIIQLCRILEEERLNDRALLLATETSLQLGNEEIVFPLLQELNEKGVQIRQHFFWPLLVSKANDPEGIISILQKMASFNIVPSIETLREYVIPRMKGKSSEIISRLRDGNISVGLAVSSLVVTLLQKKEIAEAAAIATRAPAFYNPALIKKPLAQAFSHTKDLNSFIKLLRVVHENSDRRMNNTSNEEEGSVVVKSEVIGSLVLELTSQSNFFENIEAVLEKLVEFGLSISTTTAERLEEKLGEKMTENISSLLGRLTSGELTPIHLQKTAPSYVPSHQMNIPQLERLIYNLSAKNQETLGLKRQLLTLYYREKDLNKAESIYAQLEHENFVFTNGVYAQMLDLYATNSNVEKALEFLEKIRQNSKEKFSLDEGKIVRLSHELVKAGRFEEGMRILEDIPKDNRNQAETNFAFSSQIWRFLNYVAEQGNVEQLDTLFDTLVKMDLISVNNVLLGPLIKVHIVRDDFDRALEKFEWCVNHFKATPWKNELACRLIQSEDADKLQKLTDLSTTVHGEVNSLYDLVFAFVECGRTRQARKILETPGLQNRPQRINTACERYQQEGLIEPLEGLKDVTKDLNYIDRSDIYYQLLLSYIKQNDPEKALGLWTQMQEEDMAPTEQFLKTLGNYLKNQNKEVPFVIPQGSKDDQATLPTKLSSQFRQKLKTGKIDEALMIKNTSKEKLGSVEVSNLIEKLAQNGRLTEASSITLELLQKGNHPVSRVFRFLLNKLSLSGDVDTLVKFNSVISSDMKKIISFDNKMCHAYLVAGKGEQYLNTLCGKIENASNEELANLAEQFPRGGAFGILEKDNLVEKFEDVALKYAKRGIIGPLNVLWNYHFVKGNDQKAQHFWEDYVKGSHRIMFQKIVQSVRENKDDRLAVKLVEHLKSSSITNGALGNAYSCLLDVLKAQDKHEEVIKTFEEAIQHVTVDDINRTAVLRVKEVYEMLGKPFKHDIPLRKKKNNVENSD